MAVVLAATFSADDASVLLTIDGSTWDTVPATVTAVRQATGGVPVKVRGVIARPLIGGYLVVTDHEMEINSRVTYTVTGYTASGAVLSSVTAVVSTTVTALGVFVKAPGRPDLTVFCEPAELGDLQSPTIGGVYQVLGGDAVAVAQWSSVGALTTSISLRTTRGVLTSKLKELLKKARVLLLQPVGLTDLDPGWYFTSGASWTNPGQFDGYAYRRCGLPLQAVGVPAGQSSGSAWTCDMVLATYATGDAVKATYATCFALTQGPV